VRESSRRVLESIENQIIANNVKKRRGLLEQVNYVDRQPSERSLAGCHFFSIYQRQAVKGV